MALAWFVEKALDHAGIPFTQWDALPRDQQIKIIQDWQDYIGSPVDFVQEANFHPVEVKVQITSPKPENIPYEDFAKFEICTGLVLTAERVPKSKKLLKLLVSFGNFGERVILAGVGAHLTPEEIVNTTIVAVLNLAPREMMGITSHGMLLAAHNADGSQLHLVRVPDAGEGREVG